MGPLSGHLRVGCQHGCGAVIVPLSAVLLHTDVHGSDQIGFACVRCGRQQLHESNERISQALIRMGVTVTRPQLHPESPPSAPALTVDDLLDLAVALAQTDLLAAEAQR